MTFIEQLLAIARNTFVESIRQPIVLVVVVIATLLIVLSNPLAAFTLEDDQRMFIDIGLSTIFIAAAVIASFVATNVVNNEIENRTVLTVVSKPVPRPLFIIGKYAGVAAALVIVMVFLSLAFMLVEMHGVLKTVRTPMHQPVLVFGSLAALAGAGTATWMNYFYGKSFVSSALLITTPLALLAYGLALLWGPDWAPHSMQEIFVGRPGSERPVFEGTIWLALLMMSIGVLVLASIAVAASTRLGQVLTLCVTLGVLVLGLVSDWLFARPIHSFERAAAANPDLVSTGERVGQVLLKVGYAIVPNFQVFWLSDAINQDRPIPLPYLASTAPYGMLMIMASLCVAIALFQRREVG